MQAVIPNNNCRVALTWLDHGHKARDILRCCPDLRRLYLVTGARTPQETDVLASILRDPRVELVELRKGEPVSRRLRPLFDRDSLLFVEGRVSAFIPDDQRCLEKETSADLESCLTDYTRSTVSRVASRGPPRKKPPPAETTIEDEPKSWRTVRSSLASAAAPTVMTNVRAATPTSVPSMMKPVRSL